MLQANAVAARIDLDLRVGAAMTRTQTLGLQARFPAILEKVISYGQCGELLSRNVRTHRSFQSGPCQFPTLGFVVEQYERVQAFIAEDFWYIHVTLAREESSVSFTWRRGRLFDREVAETFFSLCEEDPEATVIRQQTKPTQKW